jgi:uncharacterized protein involved in exopolysaccharide biosynthesis
MTEPRRPVHLAVIVGLSAGAYAVSLAGVTALQSASDQDLVAANAPAENAVRTLQSEHDRLDGRLAAAASSYDAATTAYTDISDQLVAMEKRLGKLAVEVRKVEGSAAWTPPPAPAAAARLPTVSRSGSTSGTTSGSKSGPKPTPNATSGGSGH